MLIFISLIIILIVICGVISFFIEENKNKKNQIWWGKQCSRYWDFLEEDLTMTHDEKITAWTKFMFKGQITQPYSGRTFEIL